MGALPDTLVWRNKLGYAEEMVNSYLRHPAFSDYPVVELAGFKLMNMLNGELTDIKS